MTRPSPSFEGRSRPSSFSPVGGAGGDQEVTDYAELARLGHVTRARMAQIMNLLNLAPDIQEALLFLPTVEQGKDPVTERELRVIVVGMDWMRQVTMWNARTLG